MRCLRCASIAPRMCPEHRVVSEGGLTLDVLVQQASRPTLADLFKRAKARGVLATVHRYGD
jgi:hypothetical protein